jgi:mRNA-degrading endonuclease toxin of MazEF toxin-antitoxin module
VDASSVINCDGLHTIGQRRLTKQLGSVSDDVLDDVCRALAIALGCEPT